MPNWCQNNLTITGPEAEVQAFKAKAVGHSPWEEPEGEPDGLNFHSLVPVPEEVLKAGYESAGYDWEQKNWGCKWAAATKAPAPVPVFQPPVVTAQQLSAEEGKLRRVEESIRVFVRVADPKYRQVVPMRFFNLTLTTPEADAYSAPFLEEKSLRADVARTLIRMVSLDRKISTELEELKRSQKMSSLWKLHADAVVVLLDMASTSTEDAGSVAKMAEQSGSDTAARAIHESVQKLRNQADVAVKTLANVS